MRLRYLIDLKEILKQEFSKEKLRNFGLKHKTSPLEQLEIFIDKFNLKDGEKVERVLGKGVNIASLLSLIFGFLAGFALLKFGGDGFVNIIYFIFFASIIPVVLGIINLIYIFKSPTETILPSTLFQKLIGFFSKGEKVDLDRKILYFFNLKSASFLSFLFSLGLFLALIFVGISKDLPFGWSTTLDIDGEHFYEIIKILGAPLSPIIDIPTIDVVKNSRYFSGEIAHRAVSDGVNLHSTWWKFLIALTLFYGVFFRALIYLIAKFKFYSILKKELLTQGKELVHNFNTPLIQTHIGTTKEIVPKVEKRVKEVKKVKREKSTVLGWAMDIDKINLILDSFQIEAKDKYMVGGLQSLDSDLDVIRRVKGKKVILFVYSYETPTLDFTDFLEDLSKEVDEVIVFLIGANIGTLKESDVNIWSTKIASYDFNNVYIKAQNVS